MSGGVIFWVPNHPGSYNAIVVAKSDSGWAWPEISLVAGVAREAGEEGKKSRRARGVAALLFK